MKANASGTAQERRQSNEVGELLFFMAEGATPAEIREQNTDPAPETSEGGSRKDQLTTSRRIATTCQANMPAARLSGEMERIGFTDDLKLAHDRAAQKNISDTTPRFRSARGPDFTPAWRR